MIPFYQARCGSPSSDGRPARILTEFTASGLTHTFTEKTLLKSELHSVTAVSSHDDGVPTVSKGWGNTLLYFVYQVFLLYNLPYLPCTVLRALLLSSCCSRTSFGRAPATTIKGFTLV